MPNNPPPLTPTEAAGRTVPQAGFPSLLIALAYAFDWIHWNPVQVAAVIAVTTPTLAFVMRAVENWTGRGFLRRVP